MPLVTAAVITYVAGLLAGFGLPHPLAVFVVAIVARQVARSPRDVIALAAVAVTGFAVASLSEQRVRACVGGALGVTERTAYILRVRQLAIGVAKRYVEPATGARDSQGQPADGPR